MRQTWPAHKALLLSCKERLRSNIVVGMINISYLKLKAQYSINYCMYLFDIGSRDSVVGIATGYGLEDRGVGVRVPVGSRIFSTSSRPALGSTQTCIQWVPGALSPVVKRPGVKLTTHLQRMTKPRKCGSIHPLLHTPSWRSA
jgi:hypothetical protein